jgi:hypothetical protein
MQINGKGGIHTRVVHGALADLLINLVRGAWENYLRAMTCMY